VPEQYRHNTTDCPPITQVGLKETLNWILGKINQVNYLADNFVRQIPAGNLGDIGKGSPNNGTPQDGPNIMKRRFDVDSEDAIRMRHEDTQSKSDARSHTRRRSIPGPSLGDELPPMRSQPEFHPALHDTRDPRDAVSFLNQPLRRSSMNPPPAPTRQLPSPPDRSLPSPTSLNFPSPSSLTSYGSAPQSANRLPQPIVHQSTINNYLPPISGTSSPDAALRDHSANLQREVSVQKLAISSLQSENDKLLAAIQRSQTRASALEKKHAVSDGEINSLTEEKLRLQQQVIDLERDVEELSKSRDESRQAAVQEGLQYVKIVERASRLEVIAGEERKTWNKIKEEMERKIEALSAGRSRREYQTGTRSADDLTSLPVVEDTDMDTPTSSIDLTTEVKAEPTSEPSHPAAMPQESAEDLKAEIRKLRAHCAEVEGALQNIRDMGKALVERAESTLTR